MNLIPSCVMFWMCNLESSKTEVLNPKEMKTVLSLTKVINENELSKCKLTLEGEYFPEVPYVYLYCDSVMDPLINEPDSKHCSGFDCWESQLSLLSRVEIVRIMNQYREKVSKGMCHKWCEKNKKRIMFELLWDRDQELKIIDIIKNCPRNISKDGIDSSSRTDLSVTSFRMETGSQRELRLILWRLMSENHLYDWNEETWQFRRNFMFEVGCAFVIRRKINYLTALNEKVENGNVGYFGCSFNSYILEKDPPDSLEPSHSNCKQQAGQIDIDFDNYNYFPNLCKLNQRITVSNLIKSGHFCKEGPKNTNSCASSTYSVETWEEKFYGLILKLVNSSELQVKADCNVPKDIPQPKEFGRNIINYNCTLKKKVIVLADDSHCSNWDCEDSQLTDVTRVKILERLNEARHLVAIGKCSSACPHPCYYCNEAIHYCNMAKLQWHWFLEWKASQIVRKCSSEYSYRENIIYEDNPFPDPVIFDEISLILDLPSNSKGQLALGKKIFTELFWTNKLKDWSDNNKFKRGNAVFFGCSIIVRTNVEIQNLQKKHDRGTKIHLVCIYATLQKEFISKLGILSDKRCCAACSEPVYLTRPCQLHYVKGAFPDPNLCTSVALQFSMNCQNRSICEHIGNAVAWKEEYAGTTVYQNIDGSFFGIYREKRSILKWVLLCILALFALLFVGVVSYKIRSRITAMFISSSTQQPIIKQITTKVLEEKKVEDKIPQVSTPKPKQPIVKQTTAKVLEEKKVEDSIPPVSTPKPKPRTGIVRKVPKAKAHLYR